MYILLDRGGNLSHWLNIHSGTFKAVMKVQKKEWKKFRTISLTSIKITNQPGPKCARHLESLSSKKINIINHNQYLNEHFTNFLTFLFLLLLLKGCVSLTNQSQWAELIDVTMLIMMSLKVCINSHDDRVKNNSAPFYSAISSFISVESIGWQTEVHVGPDFRNLLGYGQCPAFCWLWLGTGLKC